MKLLQTGDVITAAGVQNGLEKILIKAGVENPLEEAEFLMNMVSGSADVSYRPLILSKGEGSRTWFTFQTFALNRWGIQIHDIIMSGLLKSKGIAPKLSAIIGLGIYLAGQIAEDESRRRLYKLTTGKELPKESMARNLLLYIPENIPYFGNIIQSSTQGGDADIPLIRTVETAIKGSVSAVTGTKPETKIRGGLKAGEAATTLLFGIPGTAQIYDLLERIFLPNKGKEKSNGMPSIPKIPSVPKPPLPPIPKI
jgi:hypothetical protein